MPHKRAGTQVWQIRVRGLRQTSGTESYEIADALEKKLNAPDSPPTANASEVHSWFDLAAEWETNRSHKASWENDRLKLIWFGPHLLPFRDIRDIKRSTLEKIIEESREGLSLTEPTPQNNTANHFVSLVQSMMNFARDELSWIENVPKYKTYLILDAPMIALTLERWRALEKELPQHLLDPAIVSIATGLRADKVFKCEWSWIDFEERTLTFHGRGNKNGNKIPLNDTAFAVFKRLHAAPMRHIKRVFIWKRSVKAGSTKVPTLQPLNKYGRAWYKAMERAGFGEYREWTDATGAHAEWLGDFHWHGFRKTFSTWLRKQKVPNPAIDELCGWGKKATRDDYIDKDVDHLRDYTHRIDEYLEGKVYKSKWAEQRSA